MLLSGEWTTCLLIGIYPHWKGHGWTTDLAGNFLYLNSSVGWIIIKQIYIHIVSIEMSSILCTLCLFSRAAITKFQTLRVTRMCCLKVLLVRNLKWRFCQPWYVMRDILFQVPCLVLRCLRLSGALYLLGTISSMCVHLYIKMSPFYTDTYHMEWGSTFTTLF